MTASPQPEPFPPDAPVSGSAAAPGGAGAGPDAAPRLADKLRQVCVGLREDLEVTRHVFRGQPAYIIRDPVTFQSQRLDPADYDVLVRIDAGHSLGELFEALCTAGHATPADEERYYAFILTLHRIGFLRLPVSDNQLLYRRHQLKERARRKEKLLGFLFLRVPLWNPDSFLTRTVGRVRFVFTPAFFVLWLAVMTAAGVVLARRWHEVIEPLEGLLIAHNLPLMWLTLVGLKVFHELGHAYLCKHYGGHVPEMGAYFIMFTPCAYMDATSSWGFAKKRHRLYVCLGGMYFESMIAAVAVFVWAFTGLSLLHSAAYNVIFLATVVTVLFNINPLMRYDGYYIVSDLLEIPNLRAKSSQFVAALLKRVFFRVPMKGAPRSPRTRVVLLTYGVAASIYRVTLLLAIAAVLASKVFLLGIGLAVFYVGSSLIKLLVKLTLYLWYAEETAHARHRAIALSAVALVVLPAALFGVPVPAHVQAKGVLLAESEHVVRAREAGFVHRLAARPEQTVEVGQVLAELTNDQHLERLATAQANVRAAEIRIDAFRLDEPDRARREEVMAEVHRRTLLDVTERLAALTVRAETPGRLVECLLPQDVGRYVAAGQPIATVVSGRWRLRAVLNEEQTAAAQPQVGDAVEFKSPGAPARTFRGVVGTVAPAGSKTIGLAPLTHVGGGDIAVNPLDHRAAEPYFEIAVDLPAADGQFLRYGMTGSVRLAAATEPIGTKLVRRITRFVNKLLRE